MGKYDDNRKGIDRWHNYGAVVLQKRQISWFIILMHPSHFDKKFYEQDIRGSIAHVTMLAKQGILTEDEKEADH